MAIEIELFPHNETAYKKLANHLIDNNFAFIEHATGTGKTLHDYMFLHLFDENIYEFSRILNETLNTDLPLEFYMLYNRNNHVNYKRR